MTCLHGKTLAVRIIVAPTVPYFRTELGQEEISSPHFHLHHTGKMPNFNIITAVYSVHLGASHICL